MQGGIPAKRGPPLLTRESWGDYSIGGTKGGQSSDSSITNNGRVRIRARVFVRQDEADVVDHRKRDSKKSLELCYGIGGLRPDRHHSGYQTSERDRTQQEISVTLGQ